MRKILLLFSLILLGIAPLEKVVAKTPRYISLAPSTTEILFALGLKDEIVGVSSFCNYPPEAKSKEKVGTFSQPNIEKILSLKPDIVFCTGLEQAPAVRELSQLKIKVYVSDPANLQELFVSMREIGRLTQRDREAEALVRQMQADIEEINSQVRLIPPKKRPKVFVEIWNDPLMTIGANSFVDELITLAGGTNIARDTKKPYSYFSPEQVIKRNPDVILLTYMSQGQPRQILKGRLGWGVILAVERNRIYNDINPDILLRPGPRLIEGLKELHKRLYP